MFQKDVEFFPYIIYQYNFIDEILQHPVYNSIIFYI